MPKTKQIYRTFEIGGQKIIVDDFIYRRIFRDPGIKPKRKYTFFSYIILTHGYPRLVLKTGKTIFLSKYIMRPGKDERVDHRNRNPLDNRRCNLRIVTPRQNSLNRNAKNKTGLIGVSAEKHNGKIYLRASFRVPKKERLFFICPDTPFNRILAALARDKFVLQANEEIYAPLNFPQWQFAPLRRILLKEDLNKYKEKSRAKSEKAKLNKKILNFCRKTARNSHHRGTEK